jgi:hypothetical protein
MGRGHHGTMLTIALLSKYLYSWAKLVLPDGTLLLMVNPVELVAVSHGSEIEEIS